MQLFVERMLVTCQSADYSNAFSKLLLLRRTVMMCDQRFQLISLRVEIGTEIYPIYNQFSSFSRPITRQICPL